MDRLSVRERSARHTALTALTARDDAELVDPYDGGVGKLLRRMVEENDELLAEWDQSDPASVETAEREYRRWLERQYVAVRSDDGAHFEPVTGDRLPVDAAEVILTVAMGGG